MVGREAASLLGLGLAGPFGEAPPRWGLGAPVVPKGALCLPPVQLRVLLGSTSAFSVTFMTSKRGQHCCSVLNILVIRFCECHLPLKNI